MSDEFDEKPERKTIPGTTLVKLDFPVEWGDETYKEIRIKRPKGKHIRNLGENMKLIDFLKIASKCSGVSIAVFEEMESTDAMKVAEAVGELL